MRKEFNELVETIKTCDLSLQKGDEVDVALINLSNKIDEVEKRIECAVRSAKEANNSILLYTERVDDNETFKMEVDDHDSILRGTNDVTIALDMEDTECVDNNWYNLFSPNDEPKPIAVGNIEYDFPEEVYTIGNADNSEIIGDVYESEFHALLDLGVIITENDNGFPFGKANYIVLDNKFISIVKKKQIDLSKVPIINKEVFMTFHSSWGDIDCDEDGSVMEIRGDEYINGERNYLFDIARFDLVEFGKFCQSKNITINEDEDIMSVGFWKHDGEYCEAEQDWRKQIFGEEPPTMLCADSDKHKIVNNIISQLKEIDVDGETMEYILKQVGMEEQMLKQLFAQSTNDEIDYLHDVRNGKG
jgi:hypothetical protein